MVVWWCGVVGKNVVVSVVEKKLWLWWKSGDGVEWLWCKVGMVVLMMNT